jgi:SPX domain protein involved in polyphosphate accumulation
MFYLLFHLFREKFRYVIMLNKCNSFFVDARMREFAQEREAYAPYARITQTNFVFTHSFCRYTQEMFAKMTELGLPLPKDEKKRMGDESPANKSKLSELPDSFERESSKFWLQRGQVIPFVDLVTQRLGPYKFKEQKDAFNIITSIYLDNDTFDLYASRVARRDGAQLVRFRWYGTFLHGSGVQELSLFDRYSEYADKHVTEVISAVFVEVKTHREKFTGEKSKKERFEVPWNRMSDWLSGRWEPKKESLKALASQTLQTIKGMQLQPKIMTQYRRFVFQNPRTSFLRISMDSRLELAAFKGKDLFSANWADREPVSWCKKFSAEMTCEFPLVVVELKTECKLSDAPQWMQSLADVTESPLRDTEGKFSKYGCGVALMFYDAVKGLVELPQAMRQEFMAQMRLICFLISQMPS